MEEADARGLSIRRLFSLLCENYLAPSVSSHLVHKYIFFLNRQIFHTNFTLPPQLPVSQEQVLQEIKGVGRGGGGGGGGALRENWHFVIDRRDKRGWEGELFEKIGTSYR